MTGINEGRGVVNARLQVLQRKGKKAAATAGLEVYESVRTARSIVESQLPGASPADVVTLAALILAESTRMNEVDER
ncbi:hypothetical protein QTH97_02625 [Variovorax sp. J22R24]|uniref:hypothetical protein n=1 Tax=Variovorax gracilis TaxID=3053502 RepID=UPI00257767D9|nr:hypothetical protein [Variovorax sp. J22R24]MDM0103812.1 hypothetical protein [Variovorax sp. J22R24]